MTSILPPNGQFAILLLSAPPVTLKQQIFAASLRRLFHLVSGTTHSWLCPSSLAIPSYSLKVVTILFHTQDVGDPKALFLVSSLSTHSPFISSSKLKVLIAMYMPKAPKLILPDQLHPEHQTHIQLPTLIDPTNLTCPKLSF